MEGDTDDLLEVGRGGEQKLRKVLAADSDAIKFHCSMWGPKSFLGIQGVGLLISGVCIAAILSGRGIHSNLQNKITAAVSLPLWLFSAPLPFSWFITLKTASVLVSTRVKAITKVIRDETKTLGHADLSDADWEDKIYQPCRGLTRKGDPSRGIAPGPVEILSKAWGPGCVLWTCCSLLGVLYCLCFALSPFASKLADRIDESVDDGVRDLLELDDGDFWWAPLAFRCFFIFWALVFMAVPLNVMLIPARVSTDLADMKEALNEVRLSELSKTIHDKVRPRTVYVDQRVAAVRRH
eukprot:SAG11_NODE_1293_length_5284_cov_2.541562_5_plen_295_part_00